MKNFKFLILPIFAFLLMGCERNNATETLPQPGELAKGYCLSLVNVAVVNTDTGESVSVDTSRVATNGTIIPAGSNKIGRAHV